MRTDPPGTRRVGALFHRPPLLSQLNHTHHENSSFLFCYLLAYPSDRSFAGHSGRLRGSARLAASTRNKVFRDYVDPHWFANNSKFWYRVDLAQGAREFIVVDPEAEAGKRAPAFDHEKLASALAKAASKDVKATRLPFDYIAIDGDTVRFVAFGKGWAFDAKAGTVTEGPKPPAPPRATQGALRSQRSRQHSQSPRTRATRR